MDHKILEFRKTDLIMPAAALLLSAAIFFFVSSPLYAGGNGDTVVVTVDGEEYARFPLNEERDIIISGKNGLNNHLIIKNGEADVTDADCPDKICVHQKKIKYNGETIVCLPNKVVIEIESSREGGIDAVSK